MKPYEIGVESESFKLKPIINAWKILLFLIVGIFCSYIFYLLLKPLPIVYTSVSTGMCVSVSIEGIEYDCKCLDDIKKYERVFVR